MPQPPKERGLPGPGRKLLMTLGMVVLTFNPRLGKQRQADLCIWPAYRGYIARSTLARATVRPCLQTNKQKPTGNKTKQLIIVSFNC